jgi:hypothetical protein
MAHDVMNAGLAHHPFLGAVSEKAASTRDGSRAVHSSRVKNETSFEERRRKPSWTQPCRCAHINGVHQPYFAHTGHCHVAPYPSTPTGIVFAHVAPTLNCNTKFDFIARVADGLSAGTSF